MFRDGASVHPLNGTQDQATAPSLETPQESRCRHKLFVPARFQIACGTDALVTKAAALAVAMTLEVRVRARCMTSPGQTANPLSENASQNRGAG
jgi:hypothetical protein